MFEKMLEKYLEASQYSCQMRQLHTEGNISITFHLSLLAFLNQADNGQRYKPRKGEKYFNKWVIAYLDYSFQVSVSLSIIERP